MNLKSLQQSISNTVKKQGERLKGATPTLVAVALASGALIPLVQGDSNAALSLLTELGIATFSDFISDFLEKMREKYGKKKLKDEELQTELESEMLSVWESGGESAETLRKDISILLQSVHGVEKALAASSKELKEVLTQRFAALGGEFQEFRWVLDEIKDALADIQRRQTVQLATQKEQLELQREQLTKTNLLLKIQREGVQRPTPVDDVGADESLPPADIPCPYKGLAAFQPQDAEDFFGREELVAELLTRLTGTNFLGVVGPSGSGKSSVVRAGVIPSIWEGEVPGSDAWKTVIMTPGEKPLEELAVRIALQCGISAGSLMDDLKKDPANLRLGVKQALAEEPEDARLVLVVDQFEEVFTLCQDPEEREAYITALMSAITGKDSQAIIILAMRADFYGRCAAYPGLASLLADNQVLVGAMSEEELRRAITLPAQRVGLRLEAGLVEMVVREVADEPGALPMLSHALMETWQRRSGNQLTVQGYLDSGGVSGAIAKTAETVYQGLTDEQKAIARNLFLRLTEIGEGIEATSRRTEFSELVSGTGQDTQINQVLQILSNARLIITREEAAEVAHEALFDEWPTLQSWLEEDREGLRIHHQLTQAARQWEDLDKDSSALFRGVQLEQTFQWSKEHGGEMNRLEEDFLKASRSLRKRNRTLTVASLAVVFLMLSFAAVLFNRQAVENENIANTAQAASTAAVAQEEIAISERNNAIEAQLETNRQVQIANANSLAFQAISNKNNRPDLAIQLGINGYRIDDNNFTKSTLLSLSQELSVIDMVLRGHSDDVNAIAISPDGKLLASGSSDKTIILWDLEKKKQIGEPLEGHSSYIWALEFSPDGKYLASAGSYDETIILWEVETQKPVSYFPKLHTGAIQDIAFSPDGEILASCGRDNTVILWNVDTTEPIGNPLDLHTGFVQEVEFSPDGTILATAGWDFTVILWDMTTMEPLGKPIKIYTYPWAMSFTPDGRIIAVGGSYGEILIIDVATGKINHHLPKIHSDNVNALEFGSSGEKLYSGGGNNKIIIWNLKDGYNVEAELEGHSSSVWDLALSPDESILASASFDGSIVLWNLESSNPLVKSLFSGYVAAISPNGNSIAYIDLNNVAYLRDTVTGSFIKEIYSPAQALAFSPDGYLAISNDKEIYFIDITTEEILSQVENVEGIYELIFNYDGSMLASYGYSHITIWDTNTMEMLLNLESESTLRDLAFSPDGEYIAYGDWAGMISIVNLSNNEIFSFTAHEINVGALMFSPNGNYLVSGGADSSIKVWNTKTWEAEDKIFTGHSQWITALAISPDGKTLVASGHDEDIYLWDINSGLLFEQPIYGHDSIIRGLEFDRSGRYLVSYDDDYNITVWNFDPEFWIFTLCSISDYNSIEQKMKEIFAAHQLGHQNVCDLNELYANMNNDVLIDIGVWLYEKSEYSEAVEVFSYAIDDNDLTANSPYVYNIVGWANYYNDNALGAVDNFSKQIELNPQDGEGYVDRGYAYYREDEYQLAITDLEKAIKLDEDSYGTNRNYDDLAYSYYYLGQNDKAVEYFEKILENHNYSAEGYDWVGWSYYDLEDYAVAITYFEESIEIDTAYPDAYDGLGSCYYWLENYPLAIEYLERGIQLDESYGGATNFRWLGWSYFKLNNFGQAINYFSKALEIDSENTDALRGLGDSYYMKQDFANALLYYQKYLGLEEKPIDYVEERVNELQ